MAKTVYTMLQARTQQGAKIRASRTDPLPPEAKPLLCRYCEANVKLVPAYFKGEDGPNPTKVGAHFALYPKQHHAADCGYNPTEVVKAIARGSQGLAQAEDGSRLRLVVPGDLGFSMVKAPQPADGEAAAGTRSLTFTTTRPLIPPALNSAAKIVHFLQLHGFNVEAVEMFSVIYGDTTKPIPWHRFCYHPATAADLHHVLAGGRPPRHPVAFYGTVARIDSKNGKAYATLATGQRPHNGGQRFSVRLRTQHPALLDQLRPDRHILAIGTWKLWPEANEVRLWLEAHWQLAHWEIDPDTGAPRGISCPRPLPPGTRTVPPPLRRTSAPNRRPGTAHTTAPVRPHLVRQSRPAPLPNDGVATSQQFPVAPPASAEPASSTGMDLAARTPAMELQAGTPLPDAEQENREASSMAPLTAPAESALAEDSGRVPVQRPAPEPDDYLLAPPAAAAPAAPWPANAPPPPPHPPTVHLPGYGEVPEQLRPGDQG
ncbi:hypothetical protein F7Q99_38395 [Streptomyces kaniharaensis]|uniref:Uncharacterized protein n=1 Tax=Streptomyces kaniharaensis TaxID=212423 RepID=A0A6N7L1P5_9ACTN|nr:hypothetical protein [Streptomyces kaniharaensis]MQS17906.1 hypothetical protein [Streptomyces kaniharaensis]